MTRFQVILCGIALIFHIYRVYGHPKRGTICGTLFRNDLGFTISGEMVFQLAIVRSLAQSFRYRLRILSRDFQQCLSGPFWFSSALFPVLQGRNTYPYHQGKLILRLS